jgi:hypothetical protein
MMLKKLSSDYDRARRGAKRGVWGAITPTHEVQRVNP